MHKTSCTRSCRRRYTGLAPAKELYYKIPQQAAVYSTRPLFCIQSHDSCASMPHIYASPSNLRLTVQLLSCISTCHGSTTENTHLHDMHASKRLPALLSSLYAVSVLQVSTSWTLTPLTVLLNTMRSTPTCSVFQTQLMAWTSVIIINRLDSALHSTYSADITCDYSLCCTPSVD